MLRGFKKIKNKKLFILLKKNLFMLTAKLL